MFGEWCVPVPETGTEELYDDVRLDGSSKSSARIPLKHMIKSVLSFLPCGIHKIKSNLLVR